MTSLGNVADTFRWSSVLIETPGLGTDFPLFMYGCTKILNLSGICCSFGFGAPNGISLMGI